MSQDEFAGVGGSYVIDDKTQTRRRVQGAPLEPPAAPAEPDAAVVAQEMDTIFGNDEAPA